MSDLKIVAVDGAPKAIGPYSQGIVANGMLFSAGQVPLDPATGKLVPPGADIGAEAERVFDNLEAILAGAGCRFADVVKATVYLTDLSDFAKMNEVYERRFGGHKPARTTVQVAKLPAAARIEIDVIARIPG
jgi:2-iminobutanoate/2-iminopropanoate deaminase